MFFLSLKKKPQLHSAIMYLCCFLCKETLFSLFWQFISSFILKTEPQNQLLKAFLNSILFVLPSCAQELHLYLYQTLNHLFPWHPFCWIKFFQAISRALNGARSINKLFYRINKKSHGSNDHIKFTKCTGRFFSFFHHSHYFFIPTFNYIQINTCHHTHTPPTFILSSPRSNCPHYL